jgi:formate/nitrite transporter
MTTDTTHDAYAPEVIAQRVRDVGVVKARRDVVGTGILGVLAGAFIGLGALLSSVVASESTLGFGPTRLLGGAAFSLGLILVVVAGAELFTGNNLIAMAWASGLVPFHAVLRNWAIVYAGNAVGALGTVALAYLGGVHALGLGAVGRTLVAVGVHKTGLDPLAMFALAVLCNGLVCLAVWLAMAGRSVVDKVVAIVFPVTAFVAMGFEHSIANLFFLPYAWLLDPAHVAPAAIALNLAVVTAGNIVGGTLLVAAVYWLAYLRAGPP